MLPSRQKGELPESKKVLTQCSLNVFTPKKKENCEMFLNAFLYLSPLPIPMCSHYSIQTPHTGFASQMIQISTPMTFISQPKNNIFSEQDKDLNLISRRMSFAEENSDEENENDSNPQQVSCDVDQCSDQFSNSESSKEFQEAQERNNPETPAQNNKRMRKSPQTSMQEKIQTPTKTPCNCRKTKCLKLYCDCFRDGGVCGPECNCQGCHNLQQYQEERLHVIQVLKKRNPQAFTQKILVEQKKHSKGCNCKKSGCQKKYCECYQAKMPCTQTCKCTGCKNCSDQKEDSIQQGTVKKQRRMVQI